MKTVRLLYHLVRADFLERVRRYSFLVTLVIALYLGYLFLPDVQAGYVTVAIDGVRGVYNSAWIGAVCSLMSSSFLSLIGFYLVKNALARDHETRVGQILASTPLSKFNYLLGKTLSNFAVMAAIVVAVLASAAAMQLIRGEDTSINVWQLVSPSLFMAMPFLLVISALAVLFEAMPVLRGTGGNIIYIFVWNFLLLGSIMPFERAAGTVIRGVNDPGGFTQIMHQISVVGSTVIPNFKGDISMGAQFRTATDAPPFWWSGMDWTAGLILERLLWVGIAIGIVLVATPLFQRFESTSLVVGKKQKKQAEQEATSAGGRAMPQAHLTPLAGSIRFSFIAMVRAELTLMFKSAGKWWYVVAAGLIIAMLFSPLKVGREFLLPAAWIWPVAMWSEMGTRERRFGTEQVIFSAPHALSRQLPALWLAGVAVTVATGCALAIRFILAGDMAGLFAWGVGALFVPSLALAAGVWTGRKLLFEALYVALWYIGPMNHLPGLDYMGASSQTTPAATLVFLILTTSLLALAVVGRRRQISC